MDQLEQSVGLPGGADVKNRLAAPPPEQCRVDIFQPIKPDDLEAELEQQGEDRNQELWSIATKKVKKNYSDSAGVIENLNIRTMLELTAQAQAIYSALTCIDKNLIDATVDALLSKHTEWKKSIMEMYLDNYESVATAPKDEKNAKRAMIQLILFVQAVKRNIPPDAADHIMNGGEINSATQSKITVPKELVDHPFIATKFIGIYHELIHAQRELTIIQMSDELIHIEIDEINIELQTAEGSAKGKVTLDVRSLQAEKSRLEKEMQKRKKGENQKDREEKQKKKIESVRAIFMKIEAKVRNHGVESSNFAQTLTGVIDETKSGITSRQIMHQADALVWDWSNPLRKKKINKILLWLLSLFGGAALSIIDPFLQDMNKGR